MWEGLQKELAAMDECEEKRKGQYARDYLVLLAGEKQYRHAGDLR